MKTDTNAGTQIDDAVSGLNAYLATTKRLGDTFTVIHVSRQSGENDYDFLKDRVPPYMLHINIKCLQTNSYNKTLNNHEILMEYIHPINNFIGDTMGHTIVVYNAFLYDSGVMGMTLYGASGLKRSRSNNVRGCDVTVTKTNQNNQCIDGITYIQLPTPSPTSSPTPSPTPFPTPFAAVAAVTVTVTAVTVAADFAYAVAAQKQ